MARGEDQLAAQSNFLGSDSNTSNLTFESILPKYDMSSGRGDYSSSFISMARMYFDDVKDAKEALGVYNSPSISGDYIGFLIQTVTENRQEKVQLASLAGDSSHATFFGQSPVQYGFSGVFINSKNLKWREVFSHLYKNLLRGSVAVSKGRPVKVVYDNKVVSGWIVSLNQTLNAANEAVVPFTFSLQVIDEVHLATNSELEQTLDDYTKYGESVGARGVSSINADLPLDDYVRKASIRLPPRASGRSRGRSRGGCKVYNPVKTMHGEQKKVNNPSGNPVASTSPTTGTCDIAEAVIYHSKNLKSAQAKYDKAVKDKDSKKEAIYLAQVKKSEAQLDNIQKWTTDSKYSGAIQNEFSSYAQTLIAAGVTNSSEWKQLKSKTVYEKIAAYKGKPIPSKVKSAAKSKRKSKK